MGHRWSNVVIVLFWVATMSWLVVEKVLPPLERGDPPAVSTQLEELDPRGAPVGWHVLWNGEEIGAASSHVERTPSGVMELYNRVLFWKIPLDEIAPPVLRPLLKARVQNLEADSRIEIDPLGRISGIYSQIGTQDAPGAVVLEGTIDGDRLKVQINAGHAGWSSPMYLPRGVLVADELSPQARLVGLRPGQTWSAPVYNPLRQLSDSPLEILEAKVEGRDMISWNGAARDTLLVVYRSDPGSAFGAARVPRGKMWVDRHGAVLRQELYFAGARLTFWRMAPDEAAELQSQE